MSYLIAITGKGGVGKTTVAALLISRLIKRGRSPVLAVDADPNTCLDQALGVRALKTVGRVREEAREIASQGMAAGVAKQELLEIKIAESLVEADDFDLIAMGRSEGPGCYCYANNVLKQILQQVSSSYSYVVLDNEAGLENLSRRLAPQVNLLIMVADPSVRGLDTVRRLHAMTGEMGIEYKQLAIIINRLRRDKLPEQADQLKKETSARYLIGLPEDSTLAAFAESGRNLLELPTDNLVAAKLDHFLSQV